MSYKKYIPSLRTKTSEVWINRSKNNIRKMFYQLRKSDDFYNRECLTQNIISENFITFNNKTINKKYSEIIRHSLKYFDTIGVWKKIINPYNEVIITFSIYGYEEDVKSVYKFILYLHTNLERSKELMIKEYRRKRINKRRSNKPIINIKDARKKATDRIDYHINEINYILKHYAHYKIHTPESKTKIENIEKEILRKEKLNFKKNRVKGDPGIKLAKSSKNSIIINRVII